MEAMEHPILGDDVYVTPSSCAMADRLMRDAGWLELDHTQTGMRLKVDCLAPF